MNKKISVNEIAYQLILKDFSKAELGRMCNLTRQAINKWAAVPGDHVAAVAAGTGWSAEQIRPEPYAKP
jgi:hypothetical protein